MKPAWIPALVLALSGCAQKSRPMGEMHGACDNYKMNMSEELAAWSQSPFLRQPGEKAFLPLATKLTLKLSPEGSAFAGRFPVRAEADGRMKISAGSKLWFDLVDTRTGQPVEAAEFEMQTGCEKIFKVVAFPVRKDATYTLQVSKSARADADFLLTGAP